MLTLRISEAANAALERTAKERGISKSEAIERAVMRYLDKRKGGHRGILLPPTLGPSVRCSFTVSAECIAQLAAAESTFGFRQKDVVSAAIFDHLGEP